MRSTYWWALLAAGTVAASLSKPQGHNLMKLPSFRGVVEVRASLPGRMRLTIPALRENSARAEDMKRQLTATGVVRDIRIEPRIASLLVCYDETQVEAAVLEGAIIRLMGLEERIKSGAPCLAESGITALLRAVDESVMALTGGVLNAKTLAALSMGAAGLRSLSRCGWGVPGAMTLLWWAASLFGRNTTP